MTGFAIQESHSEAHQLAWEIRTVNHRFLDISLTLPEGFKAYQSTFEKQFRAVLKRGKVDARLRYTPGETKQQDITVNESLARSLIIACRRIEAMAENAEPVKAVDILQWPGVTNEPQIDASALIAEAQHLLDLSLQKLSANRQREGQALRSLIDQRCDQIAEIIVSIRKRRPEVLDALYDKLRKKIKELELTTDGGRLEEELVFLAHRLDIDEELDRIMAHLDEINHVLESDQVIGRRLDFLMQELNREANTLGAKSHDSTTTQLTVDLKVLIEQIREQVQNLE